MVSRTDWMEDLSPGGPPDLIAERPDRRARLARAIRELGLDAVLCLQQPTLCWLTGNDIPGGNALVLLPDGSATVVCDRYDEPNFRAALAFEHATAGTEPGFTLETYPYTGSLAAAVCQHLRRSGVGDGVVGLELADLRSFVQEAFVSELPDVNWQPIDTLIGDLRLSKSAAEQAQTVSAAHAVKQAFLTAARTLEHPTSEREVAKAVYSSLIDNGSEHVASQPYVKSGPRAYLTHARWGNRDVAPTDHVLLEIGASVNRYHAALMRSRLQARRNSNYERAVRAVIAGRDAYLETAGPGVTAAELHAAHIEALERHGAASWNHHPCGYSLGIGFPPYWGELPLLTITAGVRRQLEVGMVLHLIAGLVRPDDGVPHVGLSECVLITSDGCQRLIDLPDFL